MRLTWDLIKSDDPRLATLEAAAVSVVLDGPGSTEHEVYGQAKWYAQVLVGYHRGAALACCPSRPGDAEMARSFAPVAARPMPRPDHEWLCGASSYRLTVEALFTRDPRGGRSTRRRPIRNGGGMTAEILASLALLRRQVPASCHRSTARPSRRPTSSTATGTTGPAPNGPPTRAGGFTIDTPDGHGAVYVGHRCDDIRYQFSDAGE